MYQIWEIGNDNKGLLKEYPYKIQAVIWCFLKGYVYVGYGDYFLDPKIEIRKVKQ